MGKHYAGDNGLQKSTTNKGKLKALAKDNPQALATAIRRGDENAFSAFCMGYGNSLIRFLTKILCNVQDAEDITQEAFILLWENREKLDEGRSLKGYVSATAKNLAVDMIRSRSKRVENNTCLHLIREEFAESADGDIMSREMAILISYAVHNMPPQRRRVFEMSREEGLSHKEIAERMNLSTSTVNNYISAALEEIRSILTAVMALTIISSI